MQWIALLSITLLLSACGIANTHVYEYQQIVVVPPYSNLTIGNVQPVDVTTTTMDYY